MLVPVWLTVSASRPPKFYVLQVSHEHKNTMIKSDNEVRINKHQCPVYLPTLEKFTTFSLVGVGYDPHFVHELVKKRTSVVYTCKSVTCHITFSGASRGVSGMPWNKCLACGKQLIAKFKQDIIRDPSWRKPSTEGTMSTWE